MKAQLLREPIRDPARAVCLAGSQAALAEAEHIVRRKVLSAPTSPKRRKGSWGLEGSYLGQGRVTVKGLNPAEACFLARAQPASPSCGNALARTCASLSPRTLDSRGKTQETNQTNA